MKLFKVALKSDSAGVTLRVSRQVSGQSDFAEIELNPEEFNEVAVVVQREAIRRKSAEAKKE